MKLNPIGFIGLGVALLVAGLAAHLPVLDVAGVFVMFIAGLRIMRDRRGGPSSGSRL
jgi:hypothetical protein